MPSSSLLEPARARGARGRTLRGSSELSLSRELLLRGLGWEEALGAELRREDPDRRSAELLREPQLPPHAARPALRVLLARPPWRARRAKAREVASCELAKAH